MNRQEMSPFIKAYADQLEFGLQGVRRSIQGLSPEQLAHVPDGMANSIAALALHIAATEVDIAYGLMGKETPAEVRREYLLDRYKPGPGVPIPAPEGATEERLLAALEKARGVLTEALEGLTEADLDRELPSGNDRSLPVRFYLNLLPFHLASHYGQIRVIRRFLK